MRGDPARAPVTAKSALPVELDHVFRLVAFDWDGTAVASRRDDASRVVGLLDRLLGRGARVAIITGTNLDNVARQLGRGIAPEHARRLVVATNRGSEVFGFDRRGEPVLLRRRTATPDEDALLDRVIDEAKARLERLTGLSFAVVRDRLNRRKLDLIPEPAFRDPPKSAIGELLAATEARLRGAGLRHGLREAFELTEHIARELGLRDAKVTSDVKHIEVGLTDKADAMDDVLDEVARPLRIAAEDILVLGDEFGPIAGFEGSDHRMLSVPGLRGAVVVSVGPEPGGAPAGVLHLGGGPDRFREVIAQQLDLDARLGVFAPPRDAARAIEEPGFDVAREHEIESILSIANGYVGSRGSIAEGTRMSRPATFLAGAFEPSADVSAVPELVIVPDWGRLCFAIEGEPLSVERGEMRRHRRTLDLRRGLLLREALARTPGGHAIRLRTLHAASLADRHALIESVELSPQNFTGSIRVDAILSGEVRSASGASHWAGFEATSSEHGPGLVGRTKGGLTAALASHLQVEPGSSREAICARDAGATWARERCDVSVRVAESSELHRVVTLFTSRDAIDPRRASEELRNELASRSLAELVDRHADAWGERWKRAAVTIDGAPAIERALGFAAYHLIAAANPADPRTSIGARSLSGEAYRGHVFWDTEIFMLPFYVHCHPEAARALLRYRHRTLDGARRKARALGYAGALYAWESADTGDETAPGAVLSPFGEIVRVLSGEQEHHISADVAYAVWAYGRATGDRDFMRRDGLEILVETARFWASRVSRGSDARFHIERVIGPDEYHEGVDDNAFTNWMARHNLLVAADAVTAAHQGVAAELGVTSAELHEWRKIAASMFLALDESTGLIEQFAGYFALDPIDLSGLGTRHPAVDVILGGRDRTAASQIVKQADVVALIALLWDELTPAQRLANFNFYEPRTAHGSSLSPGMHAHVAARLGLGDMAARYLEQTAEIDLGNTMGNAAGGVHAAALGSLWQAAVLGAGGARPAPDDAEAILFEPHLLPGWRTLAFPLAWRGRELDVIVEPGAIEVAVEGDLPLSLGAGDGAAARVIAAPGRRYAARRGAEGAFEAWEEIG